MSDGLFAAGRLVRLPLPQHSGVAMSAAQDWDDMVARSEFKAVNAEFLAAIWGPPGSWHSL